MCFTDFLGQYMATEISHHLYGWQV